MATTPNFGWTTPNDTDYVKDGASAIRTLGNAIDASMADLEGGTSGQVLSKNSNTDMDFVWVTPNDADAIQNTIVDAKGDLITATAADTPARLAVGANGEVLIADSTTATGLKWGTPSSGGMTTLASGSLSGSTVTINSISGSYNELILVLRDYYPSSNTNIGIRVNNDTTTNGHTQIYANNQVSTVSGAINTFWPTSGYTATKNTDNNNFTQFIFNDYANTVARKTMTYNSVIYGDINAYMVEFGSGQCVVTGAITRLDILTLAGSFSGGTYILYGVK